MQLAFERGDPKRPRGHAVVYFHAAADPQTILASYVVVPPISMDFSKFIPPMFAAQLPGILPSGPQVFPLPPIPEKVESMAWVEALAASREDDLIDCGSGRDTAKVDRHDRVRACEKVSRPRRP